MIPYTIKAAIDLDKPNADVIWKTLATVGNAKAHRIELHTLRNGMPVYLTDEYIVRMYAVDSAGVTHIVTGEINEDGDACVTLTKECYSAAGALSCTVVVSYRETEDGDVQDGGVIFAAARIFLNVTKAYTAEVDSAELPSLDDLMNEITLMRKLSKDVTMALQQLDAKYEAVKILQDAYANNTGLILKGHMETADALYSLSAVTGDVYAVRNGSAWDIYIYDAGAEPKWVNHGAIRGAKGEPGEDGLTTSVNGVTYRNETLQVRDALSGEWRDYDPEADADRILGNVFLKADKVPAHPPDVDSSGKITRDGEGNVVYADGLSDVQTELDSLNTRVEENAESFGSRLEALSATNIEYKGGSATVASVIHFHYADHSEGEALPKVEVSSTDTTGLRPIVLTQVGKNLIDRSKVEAGYVNGVRKNGVIPTKDAVQSGHSAVIPVEPGTQYTVTLSAADFYSTDSASRRKTLKIWIHQFQDKDAAVYAKTASNKNVAAITASQTTKNVNILTKTFTAQADSAKYIGCHYVIISANLLMGVTDSTNADLYNLQLEQGVSSVSTGADGRITGYEPYRESTFAAAGFPVYASTRVDWGVDKGEDGSYAQPDDIRRQVWDMDSGESTENVQVAVNRSENWPEAANSSHNIILTPGMNTFYSSGGKTTLKTTISESEKKLMLVWVGSEEEYRLADKDTTRMYIVRDVGIYIGDDLVGRFAT